MAGRELREWHRKHLWSLLVSLAAEYPISTHEFAEMIHAEVRGWAMLVGAFEEKGNE